MPGGKKKGKGGKKKSKGGKKKSATGPRGDIYRPPPLSQEDSLYECLLRTRWWLTEDSANIHTYTSKWKQDDMSIEEFKGALRYLEIPATVKQIDLLIKYLDPGFTGSIRLKLLLDLVTRKDHELLHIAYTTSLINPPPPVVDEGTAADTTKKGKKKKKAAKDDDKTDIPKKDWRRGEPCKVCGIAMLEPPPDHRPQYVQLQLTLAMFKDVRTHPGHFIIHTSTGTTVHGLIDIIFNHWNKSTSVIAVFRDASCKKEFYLNPSWSLLDCGVKGGAHEYAPTRYELYYDFIPTVIDCPIVMADNAMKDLAPLKKRVT